MDGTLLIDSTVKVACAYVSRNSLTTAELLTIIDRVYKTLVAISQTKNIENDNVTLPGLSEIRLSIRHERIKSFIDGKAYKSLKRHLTAHGFTPEQYRARYGLPADYPMVAPAYAAVRSWIAMGTCRGDKAA